MTSGGGSSETVADCVSAEVSVGAGVDEGLSGVVEGEEVEVSCSGIVVVVESCDVEVSVDGPVIGNSAGGREQLELSNVSNTTVNISFLSINLYQCFCRK